MTLENTPTLQQFIQQNYSKKIVQLAFKKKLVEGYDNHFVLNQLYGKQKAKNKLPFLFENNQILYPTKVSVEQSSSEQTAKWKAKLASGDTLLDMTGGFGVDTYYFSKNIKQVTYLEKDKTLFDIVVHNFKALKASNIATINEDALVFLKNGLQKFDWIYLDPARRDDVGNRKIGLADYFPNLLEINNLLLEKSKNILVKVSPMLDIQQAILQLEGIQKIIVVAVQNEVKELLLVLTKMEDSLNVSPTFQCIDLRKNGEIINYRPTANLNFSNLNFSYPKNYIYEPNAAILKAGLFNEIALDFKLAKLHANTHLYTSEKLVGDFPGRIFACKAIENFNKKGVQTHLENKKANITTRNFPYSIAQIRKKLGCKDGGNTYLFATTLIDEKLKILVCEKV